MTCPKCKKDNTATLITTQQKNKVRERGPIILWILFFPFMALWWVFKYGFTWGKKEKYYKKQQWHCNYCNHDWKQEYDN